MAAGKDQQTQPLASSAHYPKSDHHASAVDNSDHYIIYMPHHHRHHSHPPPKRASKCFVYTFAAFVLLCILLLVFSLVVLRTKPLSLRLFSPSLRSLQFDQSPSFSAILSADFSVRNPNFGPLRLHSAALTVVYRNSTVGSADALRGKRTKKVIGRRQEAEVAVAVVEARSPEWGGDEEERNRVREELNSGVLQLKGFAKVTGEVVLLKKIVRKASGELECDFAIDLRSQQLLNFVC